MNPYEVLGVSETATDKEIRDAYLKLAKKYHPDRYADNPLKELAGEKMKEINQAYDMITRQRESGGGASTASDAYSGGYSSRYSSGNAGSYYGGNAGGSYSGGYSGAHAQEYARVRQLLDSNNLREALAVLSGISDRNAEWYYLYGIVQFRRGDYMAASQSLETAVRMEPNNAEYRRAYDLVMRRGSRGYHHNGSYSNSSNSDSCNTACNVCSTIWCADSCCECMGGDLVRCC